jgi:hypothetical protein
LAFPTAYHRWLRSRIRLNIAHLFLSVNLCAQTE